MTHFLQNKRARKARYMSIKLDISKAYDRLDWDYFEAIMINLWFSQRWIKLMMFYVRSVSFSIMIKEDPIGYIILARGIIEGDSLSPYLFLLCTEGLTSLLAEADN